MGCTVSGQMTPQLPIQNDNSHGVPPRSKLLEREAKLLRDSWPQMADNSLAIGKQIFLRIFDLKPEVKDMFPFRDTWGDRLINHPQFQAHAQRFMQTIEAAMDDVNDLKTFSNWVSELGRTHAHHKGFSVQYFDVFLLSMMYVWKQELKDSVSEDVYEAWDTLFAFIISKLKEGYMKEVRSRRKSVVCTEASHAVK